MYVSNGGNEPYGKSGLFLTVDVVEMKQFFVIKYTCGVTHNKKLTNFFKRCRGVRCKHEHSKNKTFVEMSLSSSGRMLNFCFPVDNDVLAPVSLCRLRYKLGINKFLSTSLRNPRYFFGSPYQ